MSETTVVVDRLQKIFSGEPLPQLPDWNRNLSLEGYQKIEEAFYRRLLEYLRRLFAKLTEANIRSVVGGGLADWRYHAATHKFQVKRFQEDGTIGDWEDTEPDQPVSATRITDVQYDSGAHALQKKTAGMYVLETGSESGWTTWFSAVTSVVLGEWHYNATTHIFEYKTRTNYVFESGSLSAYTAAPADQPVSVTGLTEWHYNASTHKFQYKTQQSYALQAASVSSYTDTPADQPVNLSRAVRQVTYDTGSEQLLEDYTVDVYVLEKGSNTDDNLIDQAGPCP